MNLAKQKLIYLVHIATPQRRQLCDCQVCFQQNVPHSNSFNFNYSTAILTYHSKIKGIKLENENV